MWFEGKWMQLKDVMLSKVTIGISLCLGLCAPVHFLRLSVVFSNFQVLYYIFLTIFTKYLACYR
jgi:hypothetical protein